MITVDEAKMLITQNVKPLQPVLMLIGQAVGKVLAKDVFANIDVPAFDQSAMDGYAFRFEDWESTKALRVVAEVPAGHLYKSTLKPNEAVRIFTGAAVPEGADTVVMQEKVSLADGALMIEDHKLQAFTNVRPLGSEIKRGELAMPANTMLQAGAIGFLAALGINEVRVFQFPRISIIITGNELQQPGKPLKYGQVYESNSYSLLAALKQIGITDVKVLFASDNLEELSKKMQYSLQESDVVLLTGGVSVGDYDFVLKASELCNVNKVFHKVKQRPGKPIFFGTKNDKLMFGLPGNPSSVLTCFYVYVLHAISLLGNKSFELKTVVSNLNNSYIKQHALTHFLKAYHNGHSVEILEAQESYRMRSFAHANCLVELDESIKNYSSNDMVKCYLL